MCRFFQYKNCQAKERRKSTYNVDDYSVAEVGGRFAAPKRGEQFVIMYPTLQSPLQHHTLKEHLHGMHVGNHGLRKPETDRG